MIVIYDDDDNYIIDVSIVVCVAGPGYRIIPSTVRCTLSKLFHPFGRHVHVARCIGYGLVQ